MINFFKVYHVTKIQGYIKRKDRFIQQPLTGLLKDKHHVTISEKKTILFVQNFFKSNDNSCLSYQNSHTEYFLINNLFLAFSLLIACRFAGCYLCDQRVN